MVAKPDCRQCPARARGAFAGLSAPQMRRLEPERTARAYAPGQALFYEGNPAFAVFCVAEGQIRLSRAGVNGDVQVMGTRSGGDLVGCRAVLAGGHYTITAEALRRSLACAIPRAVFLDLVRDDARLAFALLQRMSVLTIESEQQLVSRSLDSVRQRAARFLLRLLPGDDAPAGRPLALREVLPRGEMAHLIGASPETLSRTLHAWADRGILQLGRGSIVILDLEALRRIAR